QLVVDGVLSPIHQAFGDTLQRIDAAASPDVLLAAVLCSEQLARGHVCLDLPTAHSIVFPTSDTDSRIRQYNNWPAETEWIESLQHSPLVTVVERDADWEAASTPLVLDVGRRRLYLARYWYFEQRLAGNVANRLNQDSLPFDEARLQSEIAELFPDRENAGSRDQCLAVANSVDRWFSVITGGPGTGKTTTVARLLALRLLQHLAAGNDPSELRILLMAPTGKAAQRLNESLGRATQQLHVDQRVHDALTQVSAGTIHRLLGWTPLPPERGGPFRHRAEVPLEADIVLVDEASMVDLALMCRLFDAIPNSAQVILIGDRDQLASVEAGGVLSDLCGNLVGDTFGRLNEARRTVIARRTGLNFADEILDAESGTNPAQESGPKKKSALRKKKDDPKQMTLSFGGGEEDSKTDSAATDRPSKQAIRSVSEESSVVDVSDSSPSLTRRVTSSRGSELSTSVLTESVATLNYSHRFSAESSLGQLAAAIREGRADDAISLLRAANPDEIRWLDGNGTESSPVDSAIDQAADGYREYLERLQREPNGSVEVLHAAAQIRVLCAHRSGLRGETMLNQRIADRLTADGLLSPYAGDSLGRLVMVSRNDYRLDLFNGDVGVVAKAEVESNSSSAAGGRGRVIAFEDGSDESGVRRVPASLIPGVQDCFAMTIHRCQGSEFRQVLLVLPEHDSPVLSRELLYTAVTRLKESADPTNGQTLPGFLCIAGSESVVRGAIDRCIHRVSGLSDGIERRVGFTA
ncbi:MAG: exodeoxyribonuclease V alpha subunit, partial [Planctomycetaceae bacterium]